MERATGLGSRLRAAREWAGFTQEQAAAALGVTHTLICYWEKDRRTPGLGHLTRLAEIYGTTVDDLLGTAVARPSTERPTLLFRDLGDIAPRTRTRLRQWLAFLDDWADLLEECGDTLPGPGHAPVPAWRGRRPLTDSRRTPALAVKVREHYGLGLDAIPDLLAFLDQQRVLVYRVALDPLDVPGSISGAFCNHPRLGCCALVNTRTTPGRQTFTLAHELAHALFHYQEPGVLCRAGAPDAKERFANRFAAHFLVPRGGLRRVVKRLGGGSVADPHAVIRLQQYFGVSYATMLNRLLDERYLTPAQYAEYRQLSPSALASNLGIESDVYRQPSPAPDGVSLETYPPSVLERVWALIESDDLSPAAAASLLRVAQDDILRGLLAPLRPATDAERQEFAELPAPATSAA
ncbi:MAG: XRE family transcriptional regulator [Sphaerobacter sp.]|nr:XRE family transcriptional regulator [Sphaerobacter sp.]